MSVELPIDAQGSARNSFEWVTGRNTDVQLLAQGEGFWEAQNAIVMRCQTVTAVTPDHRDDYIG